MKTYITILFTSILTFFAPLVPTIVLVGLFIFIDTCFGIWKSKKTGVEITSKAFSCIVGKMVLYQSSVLLFFAIEKLILNDFIIAFTSIPMFLTKLVSIVLIGIEILSINENFKAVKGYSLWDRVKELLKRAKNAKDEIDEFIPKK